MCKNQSSESRRWLVAFSGLSSPRNRFLGEARQDPGERARRRSSEGACRVKHLPRIPCRWNGLWSLVSSPGSPGRDEDPSPGRPLFPRPLTGWVEEGVESWRKGEGSPMKSFSRAHLSSALYPPGTCRIPQNVLSVLLRGLSGSHFGRASYWGAEPRARLAGPLLLLSSCCM